MKAREYSPNTISTQMSEIRTLERVYGDLAERYASGDLNTVADSLRYTSSDQRSGKPNPSQMPIAGNLYNNLASYRSAVALYQRFLEEAASPGEAVIAVPEPTEVRERIGLERDLQKTLRSAIDQLEPGLEIIDGGAERAVTSGLIDICAKDSAGTTVIIELKAGTADRAAIGQILSYMGDVAEEESKRRRGILVAHDFDRRAISAAAMVADLGLRAYSVRFEFHEPSRE